MTATDWFIGGYFWIKFFNSLVLNVQSESRKVLFINILFQRLYINFQLNIITYHHHTIPYNIIFDGMVCCPWRYYRWDSNIETKKFNIKYKGYLIRCLITLKAWWPSSLRSSACATGSLALLRSEDFLCQPLVIKF